LRNIEEAESIISYDQSHIDHELAIQRRLGTETSEHAKRMKRSTRNIRSYLRSIAVEQRKIIKARVKAAKITPILEKLRATHSLFKEMKKNGSRSNEKPKNTTGCPESLNWHPTAKSVLKHGSKVAYLLRRLESILQLPKARVIVFSNFNAFLNILRSEFATAGINYVLCTGNVFMRNKAIDTFNCDEEIKVIMLSLESAASGANLQQATHVILMEPPPGSKEEADAIESQAIGRAHRQGQTKQLTVIRFAMANSIEEDLLKRRDETDEWRRQDFNGTDDGNEE